MQFAIIERFHCLTHSYVQSIHPRYPQKRGGTEKRKRERKRKSLKGSRRERKNKSSSLLPVDNVGVYVCIGTRIATNLCIDAALKLQRKRGRGRRSRGDRSEKLPLVEECWKEKGDGRGKVGNTEKKRSPRLSITLTSSSSLCCARILVFEVDINVQSTGHDESAYLLEVAIKLTTGRKREVLLISFPFLLLYSSSIASISSLICLCVAEFAWFLVRKKEGRRKERKNEYRWNIKSFTLQFRYYEKRGINTRAAIN